VAPSVRLADLRRPPSKLDIGSVAKARPFIDTASDIWAKHSPWRFVCAFVCLRDFVRLSCQRDDELTKLVNGEAIRRVRLATPPGCDLSVNCIEQPLHLEPTHVHLAFRKSWWWFGQARHTQVFPDVAGRCGLV